jgi:hypothetical protein
MGFYVVEGDVWRREASPAPIRRRSIQAHKLEEDDDPVVIANRLTLAIWRSNTGGDASGEFNRHLTYPNIGVV